MIGLEEAIKHCEEVAEEQEKKAKEYKHNQDNLVRLYHSLDAPYGGDYSKSNECLECAKEHRQLADWLRELKAYRKMDVTDICLGISCNECSFNMIGEEPGCLLEHRIHTYLEEVNADE